MPRLPARARTLGGVKLWAENTLKAVLALEEHQDKLRQAALAPLDRAERVYNFHRLTLRADVVAELGRDPAHIAPAVRDPLIDGKPTAIQNHQLRA